MGGAEVKALRPIASVVAIGVALVACGPEPVPAWSISALSVVMLAAVASRLTR